MFGIINLHQSEQETGEAAAHHQNNSNTRKRNRGISSESESEPTHHHQQTTDTTLDHQQPSKKRRKGVAGAILSTALDAALFTSAIGYAAYQFWCGKPLEQEQEENSFVQHPSPKLSIFTKSSSKIPTTTATTNTPATNLADHLEPPPPPYEPRQAEPPPEQLSAPLLRRPRLRSTTSRLHSARSTGPVTHPSSINFVLRPLHDPSLAQLPQSPPPPPPPPPRRSLPQNDELMADFVCSLDPYIPPLTPHHDEQEEEEDEDDDDPEMKAFKAQIQGLIRQGQSALASRPPTLSNDDLHHHPTTTPSPFAHTPALLNPPHLRNILPPSSKISESTTADSNLRLLHLALDKAAAKPASNWWEQ
ncbi:uncharacterized protein PGTG_11028 [Puccinia graminis f. sp. tritici CRL 75-36-700-3]|uniref:Uncharacterized protein n=1 Tax=Puccinia graminis f. sp. tritici (strain CRL 75-36-700-3 / race SCCL) TaxID=418459 RepID=E3KN63_PUCGT|nr:uncharacterized protein PGTG_11028 [Puccinia graminis f. sp. tritici CRL 75-36-700-3]EFP85699.1 hypothetical protein PGTG_11028 [Puccinia graminis f. sp. tritici CRL 75-36-700-3]